MGPQGPLRETRRRFFQHISALPEKDRAAILRVIEAFIRDARAKEAYA